MSIILDFIKKRTKEKFSSNLLSNLDAWFFCLIFCLIKFLYLKMFKLISFSFTLILILNLSNAIPHSNSTCESGLEYDQFFGICFKNHCAEKCGDENCAIRKMVKDK